MSAAIDRLKAHNHWVAWKYRQRGNSKPTKPPIDIHTGKIASIADPTNWASYDEAFEYAKAHGLPGIGYVLTLDDNITGADLDHVRDAVTGVIVGWAAAIVNLAETYCEVSPSGTGLRFFWLGKLDGAVKNDRQQVELYCDGRYLTVTRDKLPTAPDEIREAPLTLAALLARAAEGKEEEPEREVVDDAWSRLNAAALQSLDVWVPEIFPNAKRTAKGYRISSQMLGRDLQEDLSITIMGIVDFGIGDQGDPRRGKRSPITLVMEHRKLTFDDATGWLCDRLGVQRPGLVVDHTDPIKGARALVKARFTTEYDLPVLHRHKNTFFAWKYNFYKAVDDETLRTSIWRFLENANRITDKGIKPFKPKKANVGEFLDALNAVCAIDPFIEVPAWLNQCDAPPAHEFLACSNGLLHVPTGNMFHPTPDFFGLAATAVEYDEEAPEPALWLAFLDQVLDDAESVLCLQEWFGYCLTPDTSQQKILLCFGQPRSGKGTIGRIQRSLLGHDSVTGPTIASLGDGFGLEALIPSPLAIISDARIGGRTDKAVIVERLLSISGEDALTVQRKYKPAWTGRLPTRFQILTNELPSLNEGSGALAKRFLMLTFPHTFYGREDTELESKLKPELSGILNWAIAGYRRLKARGRFIQPAKGKEHLETLEMLGAPVKAFVRDCCETGPGFEVPVDHLYERWRRWCVDEGKREPGTKEWFGRNLSSAVPGIEVVRRGGRNQQFRVYVGVGIPSTSEKENSIPF